MKFGKPGIYLDVPSRAYYADPATGPSLTQSLAKIILARSPLHAWYAHPRLNPDFQPADATKYDLGTIAHALMIERGKELLVLNEFDDWRTKEAKAKREEAQAVGKLAVLGKHFRLADKMVRAAQLQLLMRGEIHLFRNGGAGEVMTLWEEGPIWLRQLLDWLTDDRLTVADFKTTALCAAPDQIGRIASNAGWHIQAAMAERGLDVLHPQSAGRRRYVFVVQETEQPYQINVVDMSETWLTMGRKQLDYAVTLWRNAITSDRFPGYPLQAIVPEFPGWAEQQWLNREESESLNILDAG